VAGLTLKLDELIGAADQLTLLAEGRPQLAQDDAGEGSSMWARLTGLVWTEVKQLVRIQRLDSSDQALLTPEQSYFLRENLKLRLMHARIALLQRNDSLYRADIESARQWLERYFDVRQPRVSGALAALSEISGATLDVQLPTLGESLTMIRTLKSSGDKGD
jgi:uroporphyrin-3 C-methyltransferase